MIESLSFTEWTIVPYTLKTTKEDKSHSHYAERQVFVGRRIDWTGFNNDW